METAEKKRTANDTITDIIRYLNGDRKDKAYNAAEEYLKTLSTSGAHYNTLNYLLQHKPLMMIDLSSLSSDVKKLVTEDAGVVENMFLNDKTEQLLNDLIVEWDNKEVFKTHNLKTRNKILLYGSTGNGKTTLAKHIAQKANLPFVKIESESIISFKMGETGNNIHKLFSSFNYPCVLFYDEIDSIALKRGSKNDIPEIDRVQNAFLINIENLDENVIFISATNRFEELDPAFCRRFDIKHEMLPPNENEKQEFLKSLIKYYNITNENFLFDVNQFNSYSDIKNNLLTVVRNIILEKIKNNHE